MRVLLVLLVLIATSACATQAAHKDPRDDVYLDLIFKEGGRARFQDPIHPGMLGNRRPSDLTGAITALLRITPLTSTMPLSLRRDRTSCRAQKTSSLEDAYAVCEYDACQFLPERSRIQNCGYFVRLEEWMQKNWLGGFCLTEGPSNSYPLTRWFKVRGITECTAMSEVVMIGYFRSVTGSTIDEDDLIKRIKEKSPLG